VFEVGKPVTERVKAHQARRIAEGRCLREHRDRRPPHGPIFKARLCAPCYADYRANRRARYAEEKLEKKKKKGRRG
jgi:hypothetical protein